MRIGISINARAKDMEGEYPDIDTVSISSATRNLSSTVISNSPIYITKKRQKSKAENKVAPLITTHEKGPRTVAASHISLAQNPVSPISLYRKSWPKSSQYNRLKFHIPVKLS